MDFSFTPEQKIYRETVRRFAEDKVAPLYQQRESPHQQRLRDVLGLQIGDGTQQIQKMIIAREKIGRIAVPY